MLNNTTNTQTVTIKCGNATLDLKRLLELRPEFGELDDKQKFENYMSNVADVYDHLQLCVDTQTITMAELLQYDSDILYYLDLQEGLKRMYAACELYINARQTVATN